MPTAHLCIEMMLLITDALTANKILINSHLVCANCAVSPDSQQESIAATFTCKTVHDS